MCTRWRRKNSKEAARKRGSNESDGMVVSGSGKECKSSGGGEVSVLEYE